MRFPNLSGRSAVDYALAIKKSLEDRYPNESYVVKDHGRSEVRSGDTNYFDTAVVVQKTKMLKFIPWDKNMAKVTVTSHYSHRTESVRAEVDGERIPREALQEMVERFSKQGPFGLRRVN